MDLIVINHVTKSLLLPSFLNPTRFRSKHLPLTTKFVVRIPSVRPNPAFIPSVSPCIIPSKKRFFFASEDKKKKITFRRYQTTVSLSYQALCHVMRQAKSHATENGAASLALYTAAWTSATYDRQPLLAHPSSRQLTAILVNSDFISCILFSLEMKNSNQSHLLFQNQKPGEVGCGGKRSLRSAHVALVSGEFASTASELFTLSLPRVIQVQPGGARSFEAHYDLNIHVASTCTWKPNQKAFADSSGSD